MNQKTKKILNYCIGLFVVCPIVFLSLFYIVNSLGYRFSGQYYQYDSTWVNDTGTLVSLDLGKNSSSEFHYRYYGHDYEKYSYYGLKVWGNVKGEKYIIKVNPKDPEKYVPLDWLPVFSNDEEIWVTVGKVNKIKFYKPFLRTSKNVSSDHSVFFTYTIHGVEYDTVYEREQCLPPDYAILFPTLAVGQIFEVHYWKEKPGRAVIFFDRPRENDSN